MIEEVLSSDSGKTSGGFPIGGIVLIVSLMLISMIMIGCTSQSQPPPNKSSDATTVNKTDIVADNKTAYDKTQQAIAQAVADGTYSDNVTYAYHSGNETVEIKVTVKGDVVTAASVSGINPVPISAKIISNFNNALPDLVVGKKITELAIPRNVAGSSLTTAAFRQYVNGLVAK